jgi:hypothetical protein
MIATAILKVTIAGDSNEEAVVTVLIFVEHRNVVVRRRIASWRDRLR